VSNKKKNDYYKKVTWDKVYEGSNNSQFSQLIDIKKESILKSNITNFAKSNKIVLTIVTIIFIATLVVAFWKVPLMIVLSALIMAFFLLLIILHNTFVLKVSPKMVTLKTMFQKNEIKTSDIVTIYMNKNKTRFFFIPIYTYSLNIIYYRDDIYYNITLPTVMMDKKVVTNFFKTIECDVDKETIKKQEKIDQKEQAVLKLFVTTSIIAIILVFVIAAIIMYKK